MMKRIFSALALALCLGTASGAIVSSNLLTLTSLNNSTNAGAAVSLGAVYLPATTFAVQTVGTGGTNLSSGGNIWLGLTTNLANMTLAGTYLATNDTVASYTLTNSTVTIYCVFQAFDSTNRPVQIGAQSMQQH
jgi:hypothetical protein